MGLASWRSAKLRPARRASTHQPGRCWGYRVAAALARNVCCCLLITLTAFPGLILGDPDASGALASTQPRRYRHRLLHARARPILPTCREPDHRPVFYPRVPRETHQRYQRYSLTGFHDPQPPRPAVCATLYIDPFSCFGYEGPQMQLIWRRSKSLHDTPDRSKPDTGLTSWRCANVRPARRASTHQPRATPWELGHPNHHQP